MGEVYADLYFLINMGMDLIGLMITAALLHRRGGRWRLLISSALGGAYALGALLLGLTGVASLLCDLAMAILLSAVAFARRGKGIRPVLYATVVYLLVSMVLGGVMTVLYGWLNRLDLPLESLSGDGVSVWIFSALAAFAGLVTARGGRFFGRAKRSRTVEVRARLFGQEVRLLALTDTGNLLVDPVSGRGVIVVEEACLRGILPPAFFASTGAEERARWMEEGGHASRIRPIPTRSATGEGLLWAVVPEELTVVEGKEESSADYLLAPAPLGERSGRFDAVIAWD